LGSSRILSTGYGRKARGIGGRALCDFRLFRQIQPCPVVRANIFARPLRVLRSVWAKFPQDRFEAHDSEGRSAGAVTTGQSVNKLDSASQGGVQWLQRRDDRERQSTSWIPHRLSFVRLRHAAVASTANQVRLALGCAQGTHPIHRLDSCVCYSCNGLAPEEEAYAQLSCHSPSAEQRPVPNAGNEARRLVSCVKPVLQFGQGQSVFCMCYAVSRQALQLGDKC
jgi:hypothetical protein